MKNLLQLANCAFTIVFFAISTHIAYAQVGLEAIVVEEYYTATATDALGVDVPFLGFVSGPEEGAVTYRIYVDMAPGWQIQQVGGFIGSPIMINTTTGFYNTSVAGVQFGDQFSGLFGIGTAPLDSYFTFGIGGPSLAAVPKADDTNGSIFTDRLQGTENPVNVVDGLVPTDGEQLSTQLLGTESLAIVNIDGASEYLVSNTFFFNLNGSRGIAPGNKVLIAQLTTTGELSFNLNVQIFNNDGDGSTTEVYTHTETDALPSFQFPGLIYPEPEIEGCTNENACNFNPDATIDDESCILPVLNCEVCNDDNTGLILVDTDGDAICDALDPCPLLADLVNGDACITDEGESGLIADCVCVLEIIEGCTNINACNYDVEANQNDGSCIIPVANCLECNAENDGLDLIDADGDGICDAEEIPGCTATEACNYSLTATDDDGSCLTPVIDCLACNADNTALELIDEDGDGVCDADEILGCTNPLAENYNPEATEDDGSCILVSSTNVESLNSSVKIHPNPTSGLLKVELNQKFLNQGSSTLTITDILGNTVFTEALDKSIEGNLIHLDLRHLSSGVYILSVSSNNNRATIRLVKTH